jgi:hypothetical protein
MEPAAATCPNAGSVAARCPLPPAGSVQSPELIGLSSGGCSNRPYKRPPEKLSPISGSLAPDGPAHGAEQILPVRVRSDYNCSLLAKRGAYFRVAGSR